MLQRGCGCGCTIGWQSWADLAGAQLTGADLTRADLHDENLMEVTWSEQTRWPDDVAAVTRGRSVPIRGGRYRVLGSGSSGADLAVPPVPVS
ncbi:pentapeptide repeat-containing protein [Streptomyces sp. NPDC085540]|uniref:pentapeptide repeat-containing protein n=1 Tax=Streptomyces sp. NPDC085540 TaxID=3365730 RepID=UPI0037D7D09B